MEAKRTVGGRSLNRGSQALPEGRPERLRCLVLASGDEDEAARVLGARLTIAETFLARRIMSKTITKEDIALLVADASEMFDETGCVPGIDGKEVPAARMVPHAKQYISETIDDPKALFDSAGRRLCGPCTPLAEIIQYAAATDRARPEPVVIVPAWIMKY